MKWIRVTRFLYVTTQLAALLWVSVSYGIAIYATIVLGQPFPVVDLSNKAIDAILGVAFLKTAGNIVEHNEGWLFGKSKKGGELNESGDGAENPVDPDGEEGVG